ncbi:MAG: hypothetical protein IIC91_12595 [Chloroflexi bacterium]|nr:hypothetical protein [Chloroflexota bacterium]
MRQITSILIALGLLAIATACGGGDDAPVATGTPPTTANAATATAAIEPTQPPEATATPPGPTWTPRPDVEGPCPVNDEEFCDLARALDAALKSGNIETIVAGTRRGTQICAGLEQSGPCSGMAARTGVVGYVVGFDASDDIVFETREAYLTLLRELASAANPSASDEYGDGSWRLVAIVNEGPDTNILVTTIIGTDPIYEQTDPDRRVFLFRAQHTDPSPLSVILKDDGWLISILLATVFVEQNLTGVYADGSLVEGWAPWGED